MKLVVGLGNPGPRYAQTRHNVGFWVVDELARRWKVGELSFDRDYEALTGLAQVGGHGVLLMKPQKFMNFSGRSVSAAARFYKLPASDLLIVYDDLDLPVGGLRLRATGSGGGHNGMTDVLGKLATQDVARVRIGIGKVHRAATVEHVLGKFAPGEREEMEQAAGLAADAVECWLNEGMTAAMNRYNQKKDVAGGR